MSGAMPALLLPLLLLPCCSSLKIGFVGDTSDKATAEAAYKLMRDAGAEIVLQNGDFDYVRNPGRWEAFLNKNWFDHGKEHVLMTSGNHDLSRWYGSGGYQRRLFDTMNQELRDSCTGADHGPLQQKDYGLRMSCKFRGVHVVMLGWREGRSSASFVDAAFARGNGGFRMCMWHRPEGVLQAGNRYPTNRGMIAAFEACRRNGAFIVSGHNHLYSRTKVLTSYSKRTVSPHNSETDVQLTCGESMFIVSGLGGWARGLDQDGPSAHAAWMQKRYTQTVGTENVGALVCDIPQSGPGSCQYLLGPGAAVYDSFNISSSCGRTPEPTAAPTPVPPTPEPTPEPTPVPSTPEPTPEPTPTPSTPEPTPTPQTESTASVGCFFTRGNKMQLAYKSGANTVALCTATCRSAGHKYASLEFGKECRCGNTLPQKRVRSTDCSMPCSGDSGEMCGNRRHRASVYVVDGSGWSAPAHTYKGCFQDRRPRVMSLEYRSGRLTIEDCIAVCAHNGHTQAGLQWRRECWCGANTVATEIPGRCNFPCTGNATQVCGGNSKLSIYDISPATP